MARKPKPNKRFMLADRVTVRFEPQDSDPGPSRPPKRQSIPARLGKFDPRVVELIRLLGRQTAKDVIEQAMNKASASEGFSESDQE